MISSGWSAGREPLYKLSMTSQIGRKILFWVIVLIIIPFSVTTLTLFHQGREILREQIYNTLEVSKGDAFASLDRLTFWTFFILSTGIIVMLTLAVLLVRRIARHVLEITEAAARVAEGKLDERIAIKDEDDEISRLGHAFNYMVARLEISVNELKKREKEARESESRYRTLLGNLPQKIFLKDIRSAYIVCNEQYARDFKIRPEEIRGKTDYDFFPGGLAEKYRMDDQRIIGSGETEELEESYVVDGKEFFVRTVKTPVRDEDGKIQGVLGIFWDITDKKLAEKEREELETQLRHMQKMEAITQLTSGIAHDFNNMLTAIIGNGYILQTKLGRESGLMPQVEDILYTAERAAHLTHRLLTFSRRQIIDIRPVSLNGIIENVEKLLLRIIEEDINLTVKLAGKDISVMADTGQIEQVLVNLAANARDAMPEGGSLFISTEVINLNNSFVNIHAYGKPGKYALITVADTGSGMDEETEKRIFEPFFTTKEVGKGTGLGLSIVYGIVKQHHGYINVYSEMGKGTLLKIYLPLIETEAEVVIYETPAVPATGTETILLTEDEARVRVLTKTVLEDFGYEVIEAADGEEAVSKFAMHKDKIKLLILDAIMPKKNGKEAYHEMIKIQPGIKTIFTSGYNEEIIHKSGMLDEGLNFIPKPFIPTELLRKVREVLDSPVRQ